MYLLTYLESLEAWLHKRKHLYALLLGIVYALAFPPFYLFFLAPISLVLVYRLLSACIREGGPSYLPVLCILLYHFGYSAVSLHWLLNPFFTPPGRIFLYLLPLALLAIPVATAVPMIISYYVRLFLPMWQVLLFFIALAVCSELLGVIFPWNMLGHTFLASIHMSQVYYIVGLRGATLLLYTLVAYMAISIKRGAMALLLLYLSVFTYGLCRLENNDVQLTEVKIAGMHTDFDIETNVGEIMARLFHESEKVEDDVRYVIWPEIGNLHIVAEQEAKTLALARHTLIFNAIRVVRVGHTKVYNSIIGVTPDKEVTIYNKRHLVLFGEYVPFRDELSHLVPQLSQFMNFSSSVAEYTLALPYKAVGMVCYDALYEVKNTDAAKWIVNITNDKWLGDSIGALQHFLFSTVRAIELGLPLVRVANGGYSAIIDPYGRVRKMYKPSDGNKVLVGYLAAPIA